MYADDGFIVFKRSIIDPNAKISEHFAYKEYFCRCGDCENQPVSGRLFPMLESLREHFGGRRITITSGYRCPVHNEKIGGAPKSRHTIGDAVDMTMQGQTPVSVAEAAKDIGFTGIKVYRTWTHLDLRPKPWFVGV